MIEARTQLESAIECDKIRQKGTNKNIEAMNDIKVAETEAARQDERQAKLEEMEEQRQAMLDVRDKRYRRKYMRCWRRCRRRDKK